ncbi:butyrophilin subfamily 3 member A2-like isoform 2-T2 [Spinachia spinachia]
MEDVPSETILALAGDDAVFLPCSYHVPPSEEIPTVEWTKDGLQPDVVLLYRGGCEAAQEKNRAFKYRTSLTTEDLTSGNISLRISNVLMSDGGRYRCTRLWEDLRRDATQVELVVGAVSEPKLSVTRAVGGGVALHCAADCWLPEPQISFLDGGGRIIEADKPKRDQDARGCFSVRRTATLRDAVGRVTCRVHQAELNQTREVEETLPCPDVRGSCWLIGLLSAGITGLPSAVYGAVFCLRRRRRRSRRTSAANRRRESCSFGGWSLLPRSAIMEAGVKELRSEVTNTGGGDGARLDAVVCHSDRPPRPESPAAPPPGDATQAPKRRHSSLPPLTPPPPCAPHAAPTLLRRGRSLSEPGTAATRFPFLPRVAEESEMLVPRDEPDGLACDFTKGNV